MNGASRPRPVPLVAPARSPDDRQRLSDLIGVIYDAATRKVYTSNGVDANLVIFDQVDAGTYKLAEATTTRPYARTMALDLKTHNIFLPAADFDAPAAGERRGKMKPGSFVVLVAGKE